jgi:hypothetical protein
MVIGRVGQSCASGEPALKTDAATEITTTADRREHW